MMSRSASILTVALLMTAAMTAVVLAFAAGKGGAEPTSDHKVTICHKGHVTITVDEHALSAHEGHGDPVDTPGACQEAPREPTEETTVLEETPALQEQTAVSGEIGEAADPGAQTTNVGQGTEGTNNIDGTDRSDEIAGGTGDDVIRSFLSSDQLYGDSAADRLYGGPDDDFLQGGLGQDEMFGGTDDDYIDGADGIAGNDELDGGGGTDHCVGDEGDTFENCDANVVEVSVPPKEGQ